MRMTAFEFGLVGFGLIRIFRILFVWHRNSMRLQNHCGAFFFLLCLLGGLYIGLRRHRRANEALLAFRKNPHFDDPITIRASWITRLRDADVFRWRKQSQKIDGLA